MLDKDSSQGLGFGQCITDHWLILPGMRPPTRPAICASQQGMKTTAEEDDSCIEFQRVKRGILRTMSRLETQSYPRSSREQLTAFAGKYEARYRSFHEHSANVATQARASHKPHLTRRTQYALPHGPRLMSGPLAWFPPLNRSNLTLFLLCVLRLRDFRE